MKQFFSIAKYNEETENWDVLQKCRTYEEADDHYDNWADRYPNAYIEILDPTLVSA